MSRRASLGRPDPKRDFILGTARPGHEVVMRDHAVAHTHDPLGVRGHVRLVGDHDDSLAEVVQALEDREDLGARARVEVSGGLVGEDDGRVIEEWARDRAALLLAAGELARPVMEAVAETDLFERRERALSSRMTIAAVDEWQLDVLDRVQPREQVVRLEDEADVLVADPGELLVGQLSDVLAREYVRAPVGAFQAAGNIHWRRLS